MVKALIGKKVGMTQVFDKETGNVTPVTVIEVSNNVVAKHLKNGEKTTHIEIGKDKKREHKSRKSDKGNYTKLNFVPAVKRIFKLAEGEEVLEEGAEIKADIFTTGEYVDIVGTTKGKGFAGVVKRYGFKGEKATHGKPIQRKPGSIGSGTTLGRVFKGTRMGGHMGNVKQTVKRLKVVTVDAENNLISVKGAIPGNNGGFVVVKASFSKK